MSFESYTDIILKAYSSHQKPADIVKRKREILTGVAEFHNMVPQSILYVGFNPAILLETADYIAVTDISQTAQEFLNKNGIKFEYIPRQNLSKFTKKFDAVVALDEYFTFADSDNEQKNKVIEICEVAREYVITTCKDYKNQEFKDREFSIPALIKNNSRKVVYLEFHDQDLQDRNSWRTDVYEIDDRKFAANGPYARRSMFFKQLAKFSADAGAVGFTVHKNLMYKSLIKKNYEHVISIRFDNDRS